MEVSSFTAMLTGLELRMEAVRYFSQPDVAAAPRANAARPAVLESRRPEMDFKMLKDVYRSMRERVCGMQALIAGRERSRESSASPLHWKRLHQPRQCHPVRLPPNQDRLDDVRRQQREARRA